MKQRFRAYEVEKKQKLRHNYLAGWAQIARLYTQPMRR